VTSNPENYRILARNACFLAALSTLLGLSATSCSRKRSAQTPSEPPSQAQGRTTEAAGSSTPIVRLEPPTMDEPKADAPKGELLRLRLRQGFEETRVFEGQAQIRIAGGEPVTQQIRMRVTARVQEVDGDVYAIRLDPSPITVQQEGQEGQSGLLTEEPAVIDVDARGRVLTPTDALVSAIQTIGYVPLPEKRVAPGATWSLSGERSWPLLGKVSVTEKFTYRGAEQMHGRRVHRIDQLVTGSIDSINTEATYYLDAQTGSLHRAEVRIGGKMEMPGPDGTVTPADVSIRLAIRRE